MVNIKDKIKKWKEAQKNLEKFNKIIKLIKQYPLKKTEPTPLSQPYKPANFY